MHRGLADAEPLGRAAHRRLVLYDVERQLAGALLDVPFHTATLPRICSLGGCICAGRGGYEKAAAGGIGPRRSFFTRIWFRNGDQILHIKSEQDNVAVQPHSTAFRGGPRFQLSQGGVNPPWPKVLAGAKTLVRAERVPPSAGST